MVEGELAEAESVQDRGAVTGGGGISAGVAATHS